MMSIKILNPLKRRIFNFLTNSFQNSKNKEQIKRLTKDSHIKVLISRPNHRLGNQLLITPLVQEVKKQFPNSEIHLVVNGNLSSILFSEFHYVEKIINLPKKPFNNILTYLSKTINLMSNKYDIAISGTADSNSSKIFVKLSRAKFKIYNSGTNHQNKPVHIAKYPIYNFKTFFGSAKDLIDYNYTKLSISLTNEEIKTGNQLLKGLFKNDKDTICIFTYATGNKCHSKEWWYELYEKLKSNFNDFNILEILPVENVSQINFLSTHLYSKDLREIASIIENSVIFLGADSGMMHLSVSTNTTTVGFFNVTNPNLYGPYGDKNQSINTNSTPINEIMEKIKRLIR